MEEILLKLPRIMRKRKDLETDKLDDNNSDSNDNHHFLLNDENYKLNYLKTLYGYMKLIQNYNLKEFFQLSDIKNLKYLLDALISCVSFDYNNLNNFYQIDNREVISNKSSKAVESQSNYEGLKTILSNRIIFEQLSRICSYLGRSNIIRLIIDQLLFNKSYFKFNSEANEVLFIVNLLISDLSANTFLNEEESFSITNLVLIHFVVDLISDDNKETNNFISNANRLIVQSCLKIELIKISSASCKAQVNNNKKFVNKFLIDTLYFLLDNYLNNNLLIKMVCNRCLTELAKNLNYENIQCLLSANFDYIMNDLILKLSNASKNSSDLPAMNKNIQIICSLIEISNQEIIHYLNRLLDDLFFKCELTNNFTLINGVCLIMLNMAKSIRKWYPVKFESIFFESDDSEMNFNFSKEINFAKLAQHKKAKDYNKPFVDFVKEIDQNRLNLNQNKMDFDEESDENQFSNQE